MTTISKPFVSVVMPVRNEGNFIRDSVSALLHQDYEPQRLEIIVADGMSTDATRDILYELSKSVDGPSLQVIDNPRQIFSTGFNRGVAAARGDVIVMMGGHTVVDPDYVSKAVEALISHGADCVGGFIETVALDAASEVIAIAMSSKFGVGGVAFRTMRNELREVDTVAFGAYRRTTIDRLGPVDEELVRNQDDEFNYRLRSAGGRILLVPSIKSRYYSRSSLGKLARQYFGYGFWKVRVMQKHHGQMQPRHFVPPLFVAAVLGAGALSFWRSWPFLVLLGSYGSACLLAAAAVSRRVGSKYFFKLPWIFMILHISYGAGFLVGLVRFGGRWRSSSAPAAV